jgi:hypothetical protein
VLVEVEAPVVVSSVAAGVLVVVVIFVTSRGLVVSANVFSSKFDFRFSYFHTCFTYLAQLKEFSV